MNGIGRLALAIAVATALGGCDLDDPTALEDPSLTGVDATPTASRIQGPRPLTGNIDGIGAVGDFCSANPPGVLVTAEGNGTVSHLGATTLLQTACVAVADFTPLGPSDAIFTAANGDRVEGLATNFVFGSTGFDFDVAITGGTGRFAEAGGEYTVHVVQSAPLTPFSASVEGWIEY